MAIVPKKVEKSVKWLDKNQKLIKPNLAIQRNKVWKHEQKSLLIHTLMENFPVPNIYAHDEGDKSLWILDGKQRLTSILDYIGGLYPLHESTPPVIVEVSKETSKELVEYLKDKNIEYEMVSKDEMEIQVKNLYFIELPEVLQAEINDYQLTFVQLSGMTDEQRDSFFMRLNNGSPMKGIEITRVVGGSELMSFVQNVHNTPFFGTVAFTEKAQNRFYHEESILQSMYLLSNVDKDGKFTKEGLGLGNVEIRTEFSEKIAREWIADEEGQVKQQFKNRVTAIVEYLGKALPVKERWAQKASIPMLFVYAEQGIKGKISPEQFGGWIQAFFEKVKNGENTYKNYTTSGSAKKEAVLGRMTLMGEDFHKNIKNSPMYKMPEPKLTRAQKKALEEANAGQQQVAVTKEPLVANPDAKDVKTEDGKTDVKVDAKVDAKPDVKTDVKTDTKPDAKADNKVVQLDSKKDVSKQAVQGAENASQQDNKVDSKKADVPVIPTNNIKTDAKPTVTTK